MLDNLQYACQNRGDGQRTEPVLIRLLQAGDLDAFNGVVLKYQNAMYRTALGILQQDALAKDAVQDAFISAYRHIQCFRGKSLKAWLMRILVNKCYDEIRRIRRAVTISIDEHPGKDDKDDDMHEWLHDHSPSVEERLETSEKVEVILDCLDKLPFNFCVILALVDIEGMSYHEAATVLKIRVGTVKSRLARARLKLRDALTANGKFEVRKMGIKK